MDLARFNNVDEIAECGLGFALALTKASVAFIGLADETGAYDKVYSRMADTSQKSSRSETDRLLASAASNTHKSICRYPLEAGGERLGMIGVARDADFTNFQRPALAILANQVASSVHIAQLRRRRQDMIDTLVNLRADVERTEKMRLIAAERAEGAERVERAHELSVQALHAISVHAQSEDTLADFYQRLSRSVAELVGAGKVLFWQLDGEDMLSAIPGGYGINDAFISRMRPVRCDPEGDDIASQVVFKGLVFRAAEGDQSDEAARVLEVLGVSNAISVPWRAGNQRLGLVAAYDSTGPEGFSREDTWVLQKAGLASGLVWQLKLAEADLKETVHRLEKVDAARQMLLKTVSSAVDNERRRFAGELHDDALQKLTAAELQLARLGRPGRPSKPLLQEVRSLLGQTEDALRRLLFEVRPPALENPGGLEQSVRDRLAILRSLTGIQAELELDLPTGLAYEFKSMVFRQLAEALGNVEKHAAPTQVKVQLVASDGGVHGLVEDNGRGFVVAEKNNLPGHLGLLAFKERALMAGGWYKIESQPGTGTKVEFWLPTGILHEEA
ncbi:MAG: histidine kinase [Candidatus Dormibacteraeota bacterium]|nr:histidine kinase [Candidatus Dormibacteraeota bacterium]